jgi:protein required for attachment to host cells
MERLRLRFGTWVLVADGAKALFLRNKGDEQYPNFEVLEVRRQEVRELAANEVGSRKRSGVETASPNQTDEDRFIRETAAAINEAALGNRFNRLVVVAPPKALRELRANFHKEVQNRIVAELDKTLTGHPVPEIERVLTGRSEK